VILWLEQHEDIRISRIIGCMVLPLIYIFRGTLTWVVMAAENRRRQDDHESFD
jgi:hypothetical protein